MKGGIFYCNRSPFFANAKGIKIKNCTEIFCVCVYLNVLLVLLYY